MGNCASKRRPKSKKSNVRSKPVKPKEGIKNNAESTLKIEKKESKCERGESNLSESKPKETLRPLKELNNFAVNSKQSSIVKRVPIKNPKLYNEDIPIKPTKGANLKSWWNESDESSTIEHEVKKPVGLNEIKQSARNELSRPFTHNNVSKDFNDKEFSKVEQNNGFKKQLNRGSGYNDGNGFENYNNRSSHSKNHDNLNEGNDVFNDYETGTRERRRNKGLNNDDTTMKSTSSKAPSIIASIHDFDYQPDFLKSKIVAKIHQQQYNEDESQGINQNFEPYENNNCSLKETPLFKGKDSYDSFDKNDTKNSQEDFISLKSKINYNRPSPLVRGQRNINRVDPNTSKLNNIQKELKKISTINESSWKEVIKCQSEISKQAKNNTTVFLKCDNKLLIEATKVIIINSNSGRSNICKNALNCIGDLFYICPNELATLVNDAIGIVIKKSSQGSSDFIQLEANKTLAKICLKSAETKLIGYLIRLYKHQQSCRPAIIKCMILLFDRLGPEIKNLRQLDDVAEITFMALSDGSQAVRHSANVLASLIEDHCNIKSLLNKLHLKSEIRSLVERSMSKYDANNREKFIQQISLID